MSAAAPDKISVTCDACGARMRVPATAAGRSGKCPKCGGRFHVPAAPPAAPPAEEPDLLDQLSDGTPVDAPPPPVPAVPSLRPCPKCAAPLSTSAALCTRCGFDVRKGKAYRAGDSTLAQGAKVATALAGAGGRFATGVACSGVAAAVGSGVWYGIAVATEYQIGFVAWLIGLLAGLGMRFGAKTGTTFQGGVASLIAFAAILLAKLLLAMHLWAGYEAQEGGLSATQGTDVEVVAERMTTEAMLARTDEFEKLSDEEYAAAYEKAYAEETDAQKQKAAALAPPELKRNADEIRAEMAELEGAVRGIGVGLVFVSLFRCFDLVFIGLAVVTAFRIATGASVSET